MELIDLVPSKKTMVGRRGSVYRAISAEADYAG
jgi:hypothetical protein